MKSNRSPFIGSLKTSLCTAIAGLLSLAGGQVFAQDQEAEEEGVELDRVVVTGSRIKRTDLEGVSPVVTITREELVSSGHNTVQDYLRTMTVTQSNNGDDFNNSFANGTSTVDLRGLGGNSTLTLLNGRRIAPYGQGQNITEAFVDLNSIPFSAIERIEILKDGASAIYGADAVAGVVNIILRSDYVGAEYNVGYQSDSEGDAPQYSGGVIFGGGNNQTNWTTIFSYLKREALFYRDREFSETADQRKNGGVDFRSSAGYPGTIWDPVLGSVYPGPGCGTIPGTPFDSNPSGALCRFNFNALINTYPKSERFGFMNFLNHEISPNVNLYWDLFMNFNNVKNIAAPAPFFGPYTGTVAEVPDEIVNDPVFFNSYLGGGLHLYFPGTNPNNPFGYDVAIRHRAISLGERTGDINVHTFWNNAGIEGFIGDTLWDYDVGFTYSQSKVLVENRNAQDAAALQRYFIGALDPAGSGDMLYYDPFAPVQDPRVEQAISITYENRNQSDELTFFATVTGPLFEIGGSEIGLAAGAEYREQDLSAEADPLRNTGGLVGTGRASDSYGSRDQTSLFAELNIPIGPIEFQLAARYEDYSDFGDTTKPKVGFKWTVMDGLLLRASWGESFRAPSMFELFNGTVSSFPSGLTDPARCVDPNAGPGQNGNAPDLTSIDCGGGQHQVDAGGNPNLQPEEAESWNVGVVWEPTEDLFFQLDYWKYEHTDRIAQLNQQVVLNTNDPAFVIRVGGSPTGQVIKILNTYQNINSQKTDGIDFFAQWQFDAFGGIFTLGNELTYTNKFERGGSECVGGRLCGDIPEIKDNVILGWSGGNHALRGIIHYRSDLENHFSDMDSGTSASRCTGTGRDGTNCGTDSHSTFDLSYTYNFTGLDASIQVGCINCTDEDPPLSIFGDDTGGYFTSIDDPRGLVFFGRWTHTF